MLATAFDTRTLAAATLVLAGSTGASLCTYVAPDPTATKITLTTLPGRVPELVAYRAKNDRTWKILERHEDHYDFSAATRYTLVIACPPIDGTSQIFTYELAARDATSLPTPCRFDQRARMTVPVRFVDPAEQAWVENEFAGVSKDRDDHIVDRDTEVTLPAGRHDWITLSTNPLRVRLEHDVLATPTRHMADVRGGGPVDRLRIHAPEGIFASVSFVSKGGTEFSGLGPARALEDELGDPPGELWNVVPYAQRKAGDRDLVHATDVLDDLTLLGVTTAVDSPRDVTLTMPTVRPTVDRGDGDKLTWKRAGDPDLVTIYRASEGDTGGAIWNTVISRRWLDGATRYAPFDPSTIPGWRWPDPGSGAHYIWLYLAWTSSATSLPFDPYQPPLGVTYSSLSTMVR